MELSSPESSVSFCLFFWSTALLLSVMCSAGCVAPVSRSPAAQDQPDIHEDAVNVNTANAAQLAALEGIGPKTALRIIKLREEFGRFRKSADIMLVEGIGEKQFLKIRHMIRTE